MATRLYFKATEAAPVNPGFDGAWGYTGEALRRALSLVREYGDTPASGAQIGPWTPGQVALDRQYVSPPLSGAQTITGTVKLYLLAREFASTDNATSRLGCGWSRTTASRSGARCWPWRSTVPTPN